MGTPAPIPGKNQHTPRITPDLHGVDRGLSPRRSGSTKIQRRENRRKALEMALAGASYQQIADACGWKSKGTAYKNVQAALEQWAPIDPQALDAFRQQELARLDRLQQAHWTNAMRGDMRAGEFVLKVSDRRSRLMGLDQIAASDPAAGGDLDDEIKALLARIPPPAAG